MLRFFALDERFINEGAPDRFVANVAFLFEDPYGREDRVISQRRMVAQADHVCNRCRFAVPEDVHQTVLRFGKSRRFFTGHARTVAEVFGIVN